VTSFCWTVYLKTNAFAYLAAAVWFSVSVVVDIQLTLEVIMVGFADLRLELAALRRTYVGQPHSKQKHLIDGPA
jgi:hypothetical protein